MVKQGDKFSELLHCLEQVTRDVIRNVVAAQAELSVDSYLERLDAICKEMIREEVKRFIEKNSAGLLTQLIKDYLDEDLKNVIDDMVHRCCRCGGLLREGKTKSGNDNETTRGNASD